MKLLVFVLVTFNVCVCHTVPTNGVNNDFYQNRAEEAEDTSDDVITIAINVADHSDRDNAMEMINDIMFLFALFILVIIAVSIALALCFHLYSLLKKSCKNYTKERSTPPRSLNEDGQMDSTVSAVFHHYPGSNED